MPMFCILQWPESDHAGIIEILRDFSYSIGAFGHLCYAFDRFAQLTARIAEIGQSGKGVA
jgi:hypothetical protein